MRYLTFGKEERSEYPVCILVNNLRKDDIQKAYFETSGLDPEQVLCIELHQSNATGKKPTVKEKRQWLDEELYPVLKDINCQYLMITDGEYFKVISGEKKADVFTGYVLKPDDQPWHVLYTPTYEAIFYDPEKVKSRIALVMRQLQAHAGGTYIPPGNDIIEAAYYPKTVEEIGEWLEILIRENRPLTCDIEGFGLKPYNAGIGTISFAWNQREGVAFSVDFEGDHVFAWRVRKLLRDFFIRFKNKLIFHHISYDVMVLIYQLFMTDILDTEGLLYGLEVMLKNWDDTKLITYLATNSCAGNKLGLKDQAQEFAGNYAQEDIKDIRKIPIDQLLEYNLVDCLSTWYVHDKHYQTMVNDEQLEIYNTIFKPAIIDIIQMQLTGLPVNMERVYKAKAEMEADAQAAVDIMRASPLVQQYTYTLAEKWVDKRNSELKVKRVTVADYKDEFNPNSGPQLIGLLYEQIGLPIIEVTDSKEPATGGKVLKALKNHTQDQDVLAFLDALIAYKAVDKILTTFIPACEGAVQGPDGWHYLIGNFNLGGTLSGRLSSSDPNLQNLPASSKYAKLVKWCIQAPPGWFLCGIDYASLEDRISALTTKDPNKLKVYTDGWDGHAMRAVVYFANQMPDIDPNDMAQVNAMSEPGHKYKPLRDKGKNPTFALTYQGTYITLMKNYNFSKELALQCEKAYQELYKVSVDWVNAKLDQAMQDGYITAAFGLRVRTPLLAQVVRGTKKTPYEAEAEGRSAGNALGQSWCLLNSRAGSDFMGKVRKSEYRYDIRICAQIHDANYFIIRDNIDALMYANEHMVKAVQWQDHPDIWHDEVKLEGELSIFYPDWSKEMSIPNNVSSQELMGCFKKHLDKIVAV